MIFIRILTIAIAFSLFGCAGFGASRKVKDSPINFKRSDVVTKYSYLKNKAENGVILLDVNWGRWWGCDGFENAQLVSLTFDKLPLDPINNDVEPSLVLHSPSRLFVDPIFLNYAYSLEPGEYAISGIAIKVAESVSDVGYLVAQRENLYSDGIPVGGTFTVRPGEVVFIGNFYLDCIYGPTLWRYYSDGKEGFDSQVSEYAESFPFLDLDDVQFRLFKTEEFGYDYELEP